jgi:hypothetical protein
MPVNAIPEGISPEEWNAIPDVAMPDAAHLAALPAAAVAAHVASSALAGPRPHTPLGAPGTPMHAGPSAVTGAWSGSAISMVARPTLGCAAQAAVISVASTVAPDRSPAPDDAEAAGTSPDVDKA